MPPADIPLPPSRSLTRRGVLGGLAAATAAAAATGAATATPAAARPGRTPRLDASPLDVGSSRGAVLITGTSSGFGRLMALAFAREGWAVVATMRRLRTHNAPAAEELATVAADEGLPLRVVEIDVDLERSVDAGVRHAVRLTGGRLDVLVNNAGFATRGPVELLPPDVVEAMYRTNVLGPHRMARAVLPVMRGNGAGLLVQMSSGVGRIGFPLLGAYASTKWALEGLSATLRYELAPLGIDVCIVEPAPYPTRFRETYNANWEAFVRRASAADRARFPDYADHLRRYDAAAAVSPASDPQQVVDTVLRLAAAPAGSRPMRTVVAPPAETTALNQLNGVSEQLERAFTAARGFGDWLDLEV